MLFIYLSLYVLVSRYDKIDPDGTHRRAGVILGAALWNQQPSPALIERLNLGIQLFRQKKVDYLILSGGKGKQTISEAEAMAKYLEEHGLPRNRLILEPLSTNTKENLAYTVEIIKRYSFGEVYLITHDYHMYRAMTYAKQANIDAVEAPVHSNVLWYPYHKTRECLAIIKQWLFDI